MLPGNADMRHVPRSEGHRLSIDLQPEGGLVHAPWAPTVPSVTLTAGRDGLLAEECATDRKVTRPRLAKYHHGLRPHHPSSCSICPIANFKRLLFWFHSWVAGKLGLWGWVGRWGKRPRAGVGWSWLQAGARRLGWPGGEGRGAPLPRTSSQEAAGAVSGGGSAGQQVGFQASPPPAAAAGHRAHLAGPNGSSDSLSPVTTDPGIGRRAPGWYRPDLLPPQPSPHTSLPVLLTNLNLSWGPFLKVPSLI